MTWAEAFPNFLIGLREGLEAGLVVSILLAALRKMAVVAGDRRPSTGPIWLGVLGAVMTAGSFAAVLTYSTGVLSSSGQEAVGGLLSVLAVALVTAMVFWMRRTAATLSTQLRGEVARAAAIGPGALALTHSSPSAAKGSRRPCSSGRPSRPRGPRCRRWSGPDSAWAPRSCCAPCCSARRCASISACSSPAPRCC